MKSSGIIFISAAEFSSDPDLDLEKEVKIDDQINLIIMKINDQEGTAMLSKRRYDAIAGWDKLVAAKDSAEVLTGVVKDVVKGGVVVYSNNIPLLHYPIAAKFKEFLDKKQNFHTKNLLIVQKFIGVGN